MANLLKQASIILSPTASDNGKVLCVKPSAAPYGDLDFSRNSSATRVNAQGLVEDVQILSGNLVQNGDFSQEGAEEVLNGDFSEEGAEQVTNGDFATDTAWTKGTGVTITGGKAVFVSSTLNDPSLYQSSLSINKTYKVTFEVLNYSSGEVTVWSGGDQNSGDNGTFNSNGIKTVYISTTGATNGNLIFGSYSVAGNFDIDNVSVKEVGIDWTLQTGWGIGDSKASKSLSSASYLLQPSILTVGKLYKVTFTISDYVSGVFGLNTTFWGTSNLYSANGTYEVIANTTSANFYMYSDASFVGSVTNISIKEVGQDWNLETGWSISGGGLVGTSVTTGLAYQSSIVEANKMYKATYDAVVTSGSISLYFDGGTGYQGITTTTQTVTVFFTAATASPLYFRSNTSAFTGSIDNVSVIEITNDTNLPRINYDGFSYDGSGAIIPNSGCGSWLFEPQSTNLITYSELFSNAYWGNSGVGTTPILQTGFLAPDGSNNAFKISNANQNSFWYAVGGGIVSTTARSIYARTVSGTGTAQLLSHNTNTNNTFTLTEQWQRFEVNETTTGSIGTTSFYAIDFRGSGTLDEIIIWGANATNDQDYPTSYIPTEGTTVTRNQDLCTNGGSAALISSTEGVLYAEISALSDDASVKSINLAGAATESVGFYYYASSINAVVYSGGSNQVYMNIAYNPLVSNKIAFKYKTNDFALWINGVKERVSVTGNTPIGLNEINFNNNNVEIFFGKTKCLAVFPYLNDTELEELTTI